MRISKLLINLLLLMLSCDTMLDAQVAAQLVVKSRIQVQNERADDFPLPILNDKDGNIYLRYGMHYSSHRPIMRIALSGEKTGVFDLSVVPALREPQVMNFAVDDRGSVFVLAKQRNADYVVSFDANGTFLLLTKLDQVIDPFYFTVLPNSDLLVGGRSRQNIKETVDSVPDLIVFGSGGHLIRRVSLQGDVVPSEARVRTRPNGAVVQDRAFELAIQGSMIERGDDGNAYLVRPGQSGALFVLSPTGEFLRRLKVKLPSGSVLKQIRITNGKIAVLASEVQNPAAVLRAPLRTFISVYSAETGSMISDYSLDPSLRGAILARYDGESTFTFVVGNGKDVFLVSVGPAARG